MKLLSVRSGFWDVPAVCSDRGDCPLLDFLAELGGGDLAKDGRRMLKLLDRVSAQGPPRNTEISHQLDRGIWEFIQGRLRVLWFYDEGKLVVCSHGFVKKQQKTPAAEIERAIEQRRRYLEAKKQDRLSIGERVMRGKSFSDLYHEAEQSEDYWVAGLVLGLTESVTEIMARDGISRSELARRLGTSPAYVTKILRGNANFTLATMVRLARAVGAEVKLEVVPSTAESTLPSARETSQKSLAAASKGR